MRILKHRWLPSRLEAGQGAQNAETSVAAEPFGGPGEVQEGPGGAQDAETSVAAEPFGGGGGSSKR